MTAELVPVDMAVEATAPVVSFTSEQLDTLRQTVAKDARTDAELALFVAQCERTGLDPFTRQIYFMRTGGSPTIVVSIDGFRLIAERSTVYGGQLGPEWCGPDGVWRDIWLEDSNPTACRVGVIRKDWDAPLWAPVRWAEFGKAGGTWGSMPSHMLAKVAESHALRKAFPNEMSGLYTADEMRGAGAMREPAPAIVEDNIDGDFAEMLVERFGRLPEDKQAAVNGWLCSYGDDADCWECTTDDLVQLPAGVGEKLDGLISRAMQSVADDFGEEREAAMRQAVLDGIQQLDETQAAAFAEFRAAEKLPNTIRENVAAEHLPKLFAWIMAEGGAEPFPVDETETVYVETEPFGPRGEHEPVEPF